MVEVTEMMSYELFTPRERDFTLKDHQLKITNRIADVVSKGYIPKRIGLYLSPGAGKTLLTKHLIGIMGYKANNVLIVSPLSAVTSNTWGNLLNINFDFVVSFFKMPGTFENSLALYFKKQGIDVNNLVLVIDEGHILKNIPTIARKLCKRIIKIAKTTLILSGTPSGRNDYEFFNLTNLCFTKEDSTFLGASSCSPFYDVTGSYLGIDLLPDTRLKNKGERTSAKRGETLLNNSGTAYVVKDNEPWVQNLVSTAGHTWLDTYFKSKVNRFSPAAEVEYTSFKPHIKDKIQKFINSKMFVFTTGETEVEHDYSNYSNIKILVDIWGDPREQIQKKGSYRTEKFDEITQKMIEVEESPLLNYRYNHCKIKEVGRLLKLHEEEQVVIWSSYLAERDLIVEALAPHNIFLADEETIQLFKEGKIRGIIASAYSEKETHTWVDCRINIYFNPNNSSTAFSQNRFRTNRLGQKDKVLYYFLYFQREESKLNKMLSSYNRNKKGLEKS